jgi:hypothetical protein
VLAEIRSLSLTHSDQISPDLIIQLAASLPHLSALDIAATKQNKVFEPSGAYLKFNVFIDCCKPSPLSALDIFVPPNRTRH